MVNAATRLLPAPLRHAAVCVAAAALLTLAGASTAGADPCPLVRCRAPTASAVTVTVTSATTATFSARVNPGGAATQYSFSCQCGSGAQVSPGATIGARFPGVVVSGTVTGLTPNSTNDVQVLVKNEEGSTSGPETAFRTGLGPPLAVRLTRRRAAVAIDQDPGFTARLAEPAGARAVGQLQVAYPPSTRFRTVESTVASDAAQLTFQELAPTWLGLTRNARVRVVATGCIALSASPADCVQRDEPGHSATVSELVLPRVSVQVTGGAVSVAYRSAGVGAGYHGPDAFIYGRSAHGGPFRRLATVRLRAVRAPSAADAARSVLTPGGSVRRTQAPDIPAQVVVCTRTRPVADLGAVFTDRQCGGPLLRRPGPLGSEWIGAPGPVRPLMPWTHG